MPLANDPRRARRALAAGLLSATLLVAAAPVLAHDSWFQRLSSGADGAVLALGTGNRFPVYEFGIDEKYFAASGCAGEGGQPLALQPLRQAPQSLWLRAAGMAQSCWMQLTTLEVEVPPDKIAIYLDEVHPPPPVLAAWAAMHARGLPWRERYTKHARIALPGADGGFGRAAALPAPLGMDLLVERRGDSLQFRLLRDGQPLPDFALELQSASQPATDPAAAPAAGRWLRTDGQGRLQIALPGAGRWLLRGVDLRPAGDPPERWDSRFVTLAFELR